MPLSNKDREKISELRELVKDEITPYYDTDLNLLRWLKGHDYNLQVIEPKLRNHLQFRSNPEWELDRLADKPRDHPIHYHWRAGLTGEAMKTPNVIVNIEQSGANDYWGLMHTNSVNQILRARVYDLECMLRAVMELEEKTGEQASIMYVMDLEGLHFDKNLVSLMTGGLASISAFMADHYVELIHSFVLVGAPSFITALWTVARPLLPERTKNKVKILSAQHWKSEILELAVPEALPSYWNTNGVTVFQANVDRPVAYDPAGYYDGSVPEKAQLLAVGAGKESGIDINAVEGQRLRWELHADGHFAFAVYCLEDKDAKPEPRNLVYPIFSKVPGPTMVPVSDSIPVLKSGIYRFWISNTHAWLHTLKIRYVIDSSSSN